MDQQQFRIRWSVGTKLLLSLVVVLVVSIAVLSVTSLVLLIEDKQAYVKQAQSTETALVGRELLAGVGHATDILRQALGVFDPFKVVDERAKNALKALVENQSSVGGVSVGVWDPNTKILNEVNQFNSPGAISTVLSSAWMQERFPELEKKSFGVLPLPGSQTNPLLGVVFLDAKNRSPDGRMAIALTGVSLAALLRSESSSELRILDRNGMLILDRALAQHRAQVVAGKSVSDPLFDLALSSPTASGAKDFQDRGEKFLGSFNRPGFDLIVLARTPWAKVIEVMFRLAEKLIMAALATVAVAAIFAVFFAKSITAPINRLYLATKQVADGDFNINLPNPPSDEIGALTASFEAMSLKIQELIEESVKKAVLESELKVASTVQATLIPNNRIEMPEVLLRGYYQSAAECGGDWWGSIRSGDRLILMIADATGHGVPAALITAAAHSCMMVLKKIIQEHSEFHFSPSKLMAYANRAIYESSRGQIMMTFFISEIDFSKKTITFANAGHQAAWLFGEKVTSLGLAGVRVGETMDAEAYPEETVAYQSGDLFFMYTDGLIEAANRSGEMYGKKRVRKIIEAAAARGADQVCDSLEKDLKKFVGNTPYPDDVTFVVAKLA